MKLIDVPILVRPQFTTLDVALLWICGVLMVIVLAMLIVTTYRRCSERAQRLIGAASVAVVAARGVIGAVAIICASCQNCDPWWLIVLGICIPK